MGSIQKSGKIDEPEKQGKIKFFEKLGIYGGPLTDEKTLFLLNRRKMMMMMIELILFLLYTKLFSDICICAVNYIARIYCY